MKVFILFAMIAACRAAGLHLGYAPGIHEAGGSTQFRSQDPVGNYAFGYNEAHTTGGTFRRESGDAVGNKVGSYGLTDADGRVRVVNYVADGLGYRADISSNEPGVAPKDPAATTINKGAVLAAGVVPAVGPLAHHAALAHAAPLAHHAALAHAAPLGHAAVVGPAALVGHYAYSAPGQVAAASVLGDHHYAVNTHHLGGHHW